MINVALEITKKAKAPVSWAMTHPSTAVVSPKWGRGLSCFSDSDVASGSRSDAAHADVDEGAKTTAFVFVQIIVVVWLVINTAQRIPRNRKHPPPPPSAPPAAVTKLMGHLVNERDPNRMDVTSQPRRRRKREICCL